MINYLLEELQELTNIEILEKDEKSAKVKLLDFKKSKISNDDYIVVNGYDSYLLKALKLNKEFNDKIKTLDGIMALRHDIREVNNHFIELGENYIDFNMKNGLYDKDPFAENRLSIYDLELLEMEMSERPEIRSYKPYYLFTYKNKEIASDTAKVVDELIEKGIIKTRGQLWLEN